MLYQQVDKRDISSLAPYKNDNISSIIRKCTCWEENNYKCSISEIMRVIPSTILIVPKNNLLPFS